MGIAADRREEGAKRPGWLQIILPFILAGAVLSLAFYGIDLQLLLQSMKNVPAFQCIMAMAAICVLLLLADLGTYTLCYRWFLLPTISTWQVLCLRANLFLVVATFAPLAPLVPIAYFYRRWKLPVVTVFGTSLVPAFLDGFTGTMVWTVTLFLRPEPSDLIWYGPLGLHWLFLFLTVRYYSSPEKAFLFGAGEKLFAAIRRSSVMHAFRQATIHRYGAVFTMRMALMVGHLLCIDVLLDAVGISLTLRQWGIFVPFFVGSAFMPVSAGGYGGPQGVAIYFLVMQWQVATRETALAFSIIWSTLFLLGRVLLGSLFVMAFFRQMQGPVVSSVAGPQGTPAEGDGLLRHGGPSGSL